MNQNIEINGPDTFRQNQMQTNIYWDGCAEMDLDMFEEHLQRLAATRAAIEASLHARMAARNIPHSPAIDRLIAMLPAQDKIALLHRNLGYCSKHHELIKEPLAALETCSATLAAADHLVTKFLCKPSSINPADIFAVVVAMEKALTNLEAK